MNILLVEDDDISAEILKRGLKKMGATNSLVRARDGVEALQLLTEGLEDQPLPTPFVILLDINMPRMNGHEFLKTLRTTEGIKDARVFVFTTSNSKEDVGLAYEQHANGYIVKPNCSSDLQEVLDTLQRFWDISENPK
ncbi:response regulator [Sulfitobacter sp. F26204]|uniref:response regulator n=1 Tax=Sulfitobacter sp. F26204 TaxID=2996014 RepID=UPI00225DD270|nr:response regulator [Sulfitobacter sp. F26204]